jgi:TonB-linked SusC/RagA family outer membrane protein
MNDNYNFKRWRLLTAVFIALLGLVTMSAAWAQGPTEHLVKGKVAEDNGDPLPGANVRIKGTTIGTVADADGNFTFTIPDANGQAVTIESTFIGYAAVSNSIVALAGQSTTLEVKLLTDFLALDEVVVTGQGVATTRKQLGNYISTINASSISNGAANNPIAALQGKVAGAQIMQNNGNPAGGFTVRLRGASTIVGSSEPLYIVDGVIVNNGTNNVTDLSITISGNNDFSPGTNRMADINPNDIERIEVINGAAASAIYGSRASNGVVQIFTKKGVTGKPTVTFSTSVTVSELRKKIDVNMHPERFGPPTNRFPVTSGEINDQRLTAILLFNRLFPTKSPAQRYDYQDDIFRTGIGSDNYFSVSGGSDKTKYLFSGSHYINEGTVKGTDFSRYSAKLRIDQTLNSWAKLSVGSNFIRSFANERPDGNSFYSPINSVFIIDNAYDLNERDANGKLLAVEPTRLNPLSVIEGIKMTNTVNRVISDMQLNLTPVSGLRVDYTFGLDTYSQLGQTFIDRYPYPGVNLAFFADGYASNATQQVLQLNNDLTISYQTDIAEDIESTTVIGGTVQYDKSNFSQIQGRDMIPLIETVNGAKTPVGAASEFITERSIQGAFLQQTFSYKQFVYLTAAGRIDGSSVFGKQNRSQFYPKASVNLIASELFKDAAWTKKFNLVKFRFAYGESGNLTNLGPYSRFSNYDPLAYVGNTRPFVRSQTQGNPDVGPERQSEIEFGLDLAALNNRIGFEVNVYNKKVKDLLLDLTIAPSTGSANVNTNIGSLTNKGVEVIVKGTPVKTSNFTWNITVIFSRNRNRVDLPDNLPLIRFSADANRMSSALDGRPLGVFYGTAYARNPDGSTFLTTQPRVISTVTFPAGTPSVDRVNRDPVSGLPTGALVQRELGDPNPDWTGSLLNEFTYKRFTARILLDAVQGFDVNNLNWTTYNNVGAGLLAQQELRGEIPRGTVSLIGGFGDERIREEMVEDGSFTKLREISFGYTVVPKFLGLSSLSINLIGRNLYSWDNYRGWDPETNSAGQSNRIRGDDFGNVPIPRTYQLSLTAKF